MTSPSELAGKDEGFVLGKWFESIADLIGANPAVAGTERHRTIEYDRTTASDLGRSFNACATGKRLAPDGERARAARHIYRLDGSGSPGGLDDAHLKRLRNAGIGFAIREAFGPDVMLEKMQKLFGTGKKHGIDIAVHELEQGRIAIDVTPPPKPQPVPKPPPPTKLFKRMF